MGRSPHKRRLASAAVHTSRINSISVPKPHVTSVVEMFLVLLCPLFVQYVSSIDANERLSKCIPGFKKFSQHAYIHENEGVWFPQYRTRHPGNDKYKCHVLNEKMTINSDEEPAIRVDSYYTKNNVPQTGPYIQSYKQLNRGIIVDEESDKHNGNYNVYSYLVKLTPEYRVRYVCTDMRMKGTKDPTFYIETRSMTPKLEVINRAVKDVQGTGVKVVLDRIDQKKCKRPLTPDGYDKGT